MVRGIVLHSHMEMTEQEQLQKWVDAWKVAGPMMEKFRADDLAALTDEAAARQFASLTKGPMLYDMPDDGLIEQQRITQLLASWKS